MQSYVHSERLKSFFKHVCIVAQTYQERQVANDNLQKQIIRIKKISTGAHKGSFEHEVKKLESKIAKVVDKEAKLMKVDRKQNSIVKQLNARLKSVEDELHDTKKSKDTQSRSNRAKMETLKNSILGLKSQVDRLVEIKKEKDRREMELDKRIRAVTG